MLWLVVAVSYWLRPDALAALTAWPMWTWAVPGIGLALPAFRRRRVRPALVVALVWLVWVALAAEEPASLIRAGLSRGGETDLPSGAVRVVTLNCSGGSATAADEVARYDPDVVLLQEAPGRAEVRSLALRLFGRTGGVAWGPDTAVVARMPCRPIPLPRDVAGCCTGATAHLGQQRMAIYSVRLAPPVFRTDPWSAAWWRAYSADRRARRRQAQQVAAAVDRESRGLPVILGGDMNAPAGDGSLRPFRSRLRDCFGASGRGWGNTVLNDFPVLRFDQIWASGDVRPVKVVAERTVHSDHRLVVCDVILQ